MSLFYYWRGYIAFYICWNSLQADESGRPVFAFSSLSSHTPDLRADSRASLTVTAPGYQARLP